MVVVDEGKKEKEGERRSFIGCVGTESTSLPCRDDRIAAADDWKKAI
jgi:hypothetical protein